MNCQDNTILTKINEINIVSARYQIRTGTPLRHEIFLPHHVAMTVQNVVVWTMSSPYQKDLGGWYIVSTHLGYIIHLARRCLRESFAELATIHRGVFQPKCSNLSSFARLPITSISHSQYSIIKNMVSRTRVELVLQP